MSELRTPNSSVRSFQRNVGTTGGNPTRHIETSSGNAQDCYHARGVIIGRPVSIEC